MDDIKLTIAIDGPASAGKSSIAREIAKRLGITYIDTGAMFRAITYNLMNLDIDLSDDYKIKESMNTLDLKFINDEVYLNDINISKDIRRNIVSQKASIVAEKEYIRDYLLSLQREMSLNQSVIMDGRDIGSVVLPNADFKFFITASIDERANRRYKELLEKGEKNISKEQIRNEISTRDIKDTTRKIAPLVQADDAILIDNTFLTKEESINKIINIIKSEKDVL